MGGQSEAAQQNRAAQEQYRQQLKIRAANFAKESALYNARIASSREQIFENQKAAGRAYQSEQARLNEIYRQAAFGTQARSIQSAQEMGRATAAGRTGVSASRVAGNVLAEFGRNQAIQAQSLMSAQDAFTRANERTRDRLFADNRRSYESIGLAPTPGLMPIQPAQVQGPSWMSLLGDVSGAVVTGLNTENDIRSARGQKPLFS